MNQKLKYFVYSQNSLNTFKSCPLKFKYKYIENINWKFDGIESRDYYEGLKSGSEFHLLCERYFKNIPIGENISEEFKLWMIKIKDTIKIDSSKIYLPEAAVVLDDSGEKYRKVDGKLNPDVFQSLVISRTNLYRTWPDCWKPLRNLRSCFKNSGSYPCYWACGICSRRRS